MKHILFEASRGQKLVDALRDPLERALGRLTAQGEREKLILQGSVFHAKRRLKDPDLAFWDDTGHCELFYPELEVLEFSLDPARINFEDTDILVVDKPGGLNTAPSPFSDIDCLTWGVERYLRTTGIDYRVSAVHRLDRDTRGLIFFAKNKAAELALHKMFREDRVRKIYAAHTPFFEKSDLGPRSRLYRIRDTLDWRGKEQRAATTIISIDAAEHRPFALTGNSRDTVNGLSWLALPHTGRPHQIRKHFARYLMPITGDRVYAPELYGSGTRLELVCIEYRCRHPLTGRPLRLRRSGISEP